MAITSTVQVQGLAELDAVLSGLPDEVEGAIMEAALSAAGQVVLRAAQGNIHSRTGRTAADIRAEVQVVKGEDQGVVGVGGTFAGGTGRAYVLRWLEFGTAAHPIKAGEKSRRLISKGVSRARRDRNATAAQRIAGLRSRVARALRLPGGLFRASVVHPGTQNQSPLTRALFEHGQDAVAVLRDTLWQGIVTYTRSLPKAS